jgi:hypothetical protein
VASSRDGNLEARTFIVTFEPVVEEARIECIARARCVDDLNLWSGKRETLAGPCKDRPFATLFQHDEREVADKETESFVRIICASDGCGFFDIRQKKIDAATVLKKSRIAY